MSTEQLYTLAMMQLTLVLLLAASRVRPPKNQLTSLRYFLIPLAGFYTFGQQFRLFIQFQFGQCT